MTRLMWASIRGLLARVIELIEWNSDVNAEDDQAMTPLLFACEEGHVEVARELLRRGANPNAAQEGGLTALHFSIPHPAVTRLLLDSGADFRAKDWNGNELLGHVCEEGCDVGLIRELAARGADLDALGGNGETPLMAAAYNGHVEIARELLALGADVRVRGTLGSTALQAASSGGCTEIVHELLKRSDVDVNTRDNEGNTPLMNACLTGALAAAAALVGAGANLAMLNNGGTSALHIAEELAAREAPLLSDTREVSRKDLSAIVALLKAHGAS